MRKPTFGLMLLPLHQWTLDTYEWMDGDVKIHTLYLGPIVLSWWFD